jgi:hypothetical protein
MPQNNVVRRPQFFDGQGIDPQDLNRAVSGARAFLTDLVVGPLLASFRNVVGPISSNPASALTTSPASYPTLYAQGHAGAPRNRAGNRVVGCNPGILYYVAPSLTIDGATPKVVPYYLTTDEIAATLAAGDASNPRFDAIFVRITDTDGPQETRDFKDATGVVSSQVFFTSKATTLEFTVVQGTPAAKPLMPTPPNSTWAFWGAWWVPKAFGAASFTTVPHPYGGSNVQDYRVPIGMKKHLLTVGDGLQAGGTNAHANAYYNTMTFTSTSGSPDMWANLPVRSGRIMAYGFTQSNVGGGTKAWLSAIVPSAAANFVVNSPPWFMTIYGGRSTGDPTIIQELDYTTQIRGGNWYATDGFTPVSTVNGFQLLPLWANGFGSEAEDSTQIGGISSNIAGGVTAYGVDAAPVMRMYGMPTTVGEIVTGAVFDVAG